VARPLVEVAAVAIEEEGVDSIRTLVELSLAQSHELSLQRSRNIMKKRGLCYKCHRKRHMGFNCPELKSKGQVNTSNKQN
jgi:hypothetical protein